jgi:hypothetical protein
MLFPGRGGESIYGGKFPGMAISFFLAIIEFFC